MNLASRFPSLKQLAPVYSVAVAIIYGWSIIRFFWRIPSLINYSTTSELGVIFSYLITVNLIESIAVVLMPVILGLILPQKWFLERFVTKSVLLVSMGLGYMMYVASHINTNEPFPYTLFPWMPVVFPLILALVFLLDQIIFLRKILEDISDRFVVFLFISLPVSVVCILVVLFRNIL